MNTIKRLQISRTHSGSTNYLLIVQSEIVKFSHNKAVKYDPSEKEVIVLKDYEIPESNEDNSDEGINNLLNYLKKDVFNDNNVATNKYKHFRIILADDTDIIVSNYQETLDHFKIVDTE